jgi:hypothetical protein
MPDRTVRHGRADAACRVRGLGRELVKRRYLDGRVS